MAALALGIAREPRAVQPLLQALTEKDERLRAAAVEALAELEDRRAVEPLIAALGDREADVSRGAAAALESLTGQNFGKDATRWQAWWKANRATQPSAGLVSAPAPWPGTVTDTRVSEPAAAVPPLRELYTQAYADFARGNYDLAIQGFQEYLRNGKGADLADQAQYWLGERLYVKLEFEDAIGAWNALLRDYPTSDRQPDARLKKGLALEKLGRRSEAELEYRFVIERFPGSQAARLARSKLEPRQ